MKTEIERVCDEIKRIHYGDAWHGPALHEVLAGISAPQAAARPLADVHSIWEIVRHITVWETVFRRRLEGDAAEEPEEGDFPDLTDTSTAAWGTTIMMLDEEHERLLATVASLRDGDLERNVAPRDYPIYFLLDVTVRHHVYHTGQIALLKKA